MIHNEYIGTPISLAPALQDASDEDDPQSQQPLLPDKSKKRELLSRLSVDFVKTEFDDMLEEQRKDMDKVENPAVNTWLSSAIQFGEISYDDIRRMSLSAGKKSMAGFMRDSDVLVQASDENMVVEILPKVGAVQVNGKNIPTKNGTDYATLHLYEVSAFELVPPDEIEEDDDQGCSCFGIFGNKKVDKNAARGTRNVFAEVSIVGDALAKTWKDSRESQVERLDVQYDTLNPSWKIQGLQGQIPTKKKPKCSILSFNLNFSEIWSSSIRFKLVDADSHEILGWIDLDLQKLFDASLGSVMTQQIRPLEMHEAMKSKIYLKSGSLKLNNEKENAKAADSALEMKNASPDVNVGKVRLKIGVSSNCFLIDLLRGPDEDMILYGLGLIFKLIQMVDLQQLYTSNLEVVENSNDSAIDPAPQISSSLYIEETTHPLGFLLIPQNFQYIFSAFEIVDRNPSEVETNAHTAIRKKAIHLIGTIFNIGIQKLGPLFTNSLETFGDQIASFVDLSRFEEEFVIGFLEIINLVPLRAKLEAATCNEGHLIDVLLQLASAERIEDIQAQALSMLNGLAEKLKGYGNWRAILLKKIENAGIDSYLIECVESWHPKIADESLSLIEILAENNCIELSQNLIETLKRIENENGDGKAAKIVQKILFKIEFGLKVLSVNFVSSSCSSKAINSLNNLAKLNSSIAQTPRGIYKNVVIVLEFSKHDSFVTHIAGMVPRYSSSHSAQCISCFLSKNPPSKEEIEKISIMKVDEIKSLIQAGSSIDSLTPCTILNFSDTAFCEERLSKPLIASYLILLVNPDSFFRSTNRVDLGYIAPIGLDSFDQIEELRLRDPSQILGEVSPLIGIKIPKRPNSNLLSMLNSPEMMRNLPS